MVALFLCHSVVPFRNQMLHRKQLEEGFTLTLQETRSIHDSMNIPKIEFIS